jgi:hypothetical protein
MELAWQLGLPTQPSHHLVPLQISASGAMVFNFPKFVFTSIIPTINYHQ